MEKLISVAVMRDSDAAEIASGTDSKILMYRAGLGIFRSFDWHGRIDIVTGSGNNGGDGYAAARLWRMDGGRSLVWEVTGMCWLCCCTGTGFPAASSAPAKSVLRTVTTSSPSVRNGGFPSPQKRTFPAQTRSWTACWERGSAGNFARICGRWWNRSTSLLRQC